MMIRRMLTGVVLAGVMWSPMAIVAQAPMQQSAGDTQTLPLDQIVTSTVHEAWVASGRNEDKFFAMVKQLAELSAQKRGITLPETQEAGAKAGEWIKKEARRDPDQLLYVVVDRAVRYVGKMQASGTAAPTTK
jgi:hypothetical protein